MACFTISAGMQWDILMSHHGIESVFIYKNTDLPAHRTHAIGPGMVSVFTTRAPEKLTSNEDSAAIITLDNTTALLAVADGVGGLPAGAKASALLVETLQQACDRSAHENIELRDAVLSAIEEANRKIIASGNGSATTLAAVIIQDRFIRTCHAGDSMILITGRLGRVISETVPHSPIGYAVESGILSEDEAIRHEDRHLVSNVLGSPDLHLSMGMPIQLKRYDTLLLASDGLFDNLEKETIVDIIRKGPLDECSGKLRELAVTRMRSNIPPCKPDDLTFILFRCTT